MPKRSSSDVISAFKFHGVEFQRSSGRERIATCPFCDKTGHFYVNSENGLWNCKRCGEEGNLTTFLARIHAAALETTGTDDYKDLASIKPGIPWKVFQEHHLALCNRFSTPRWLIPVYNKRLSLVNLRVYIPKDNKVLGTPSLPLNLYGVDRMRATGTLYVCEGEWDYFALYNLLKRAKAKDTAVAVPGASVWKKEWTSMLTNSRDVRFAYDNDSAGIDGQAKAAFACQGHASTVGTIHWPSELPEGFDVRDFTENNKSMNPSTLYATFKRLFNSTSSLDGEETETTSKPALKRESFQSVLRDYKARIHLDQNMIDGLAVMFATVFSIQIPGDPLWMFIVGPPGCGKSLVLRSMERSAYAIFRSTLTPNSLVSGYIPPSGDAEDDPSLIPQLTGKTLVIKDYTAVTSMSFSDQENLYGILRDAYDGLVQKSFGNGLHREYPDCHFAILAGVTDVIHHKNRAALGERFLKFQFVRDWDYNATDQMVAAAEGMAKQVENEDYLREVSAAFLDRQIDPDKLPKLSKTMLRRLISFCQVIAVLRTEVNREQYRPRPEVGTRLVKQLVKLSQCLAFVLGKNTVDEKVYSIIQNVGFDTVHGYAADLLRAVLDSYPVPVTMHELELRLKCPRTTLDRRREDLMMLDAVETVPLPETKSPNSRQETHRRGRPTLGVAPTARMVQLWKEAGLPFGKDKRCKNKRTSTKATGKNVGRKEPSRKKASSAKKGRPVSKKAAVPRPSRKKTVVRRR